MLGSRRRRLPLGQWLLRLSVGGALVLASFAVAAPDPSATPTVSWPPTILDTEKIERAIEHGGWAQRGTSPRVSCPSGVYQERGVEFSCTAVVEGESTRFLVTVLDGLGHVHYEERPRRAAPFPSD